MSFLLILLAVVFIWCLISLRKPSPSIICPFGREEDDEEDDEEEYDDEDDENDENDEEEGWDEWEDWEEEKPRRRRRKKTRGIIVDPTETHISSDAFVDPSETHIDGAFITVQKTRR